jgi:cysteinyl-tRNA synthetase
MNDTNLNLRLHNTRTHCVENFVAQDPGRVTVYLCGPTVYNYVHIGNARGPWYSACLCACSGI